MISFNRHIITLVFRGALRFGIALCMMLMVEVVQAQTKTELKDFSKDSLTLSEVLIFGKSKSQQLRDGAYTVSVIDATSLKGKTQTLADALGRTAGIKIRTSGGLGSDFDTSLNGMSGNSIRIFMDGVPLNQIGNNINIQNIPLSNIERVEIYKGVTPAEFGADALGGVINIVTAKKKNNYIEASVSAGSFKTFQGDISGRWADRKTGIFLHPQVSYAHSKNNYTMRDMKVWSEERDEYILADRKRFHDAYDNLLVSVETGIENKPWTDALTLSASYTMTNKEMQTGSVQTIIYGMAERKMEAWNIQARYRKKDFLIKGLSTNLLLSHTWDNTLVIDTACRRYNWDGEYVSTDRNETTGRAPMMRRIKRPLILARVNLDYKPSENHTINFNYMLTSTGNNRTDDLMKDYDFVPSSDRMTKHILGLTYNQNFFDNRLTNSFFVKDYILHVRIDQTDFAWKTNLDEVGNKMKNNNLGGGVATRFSFFDELNVKASYERAIRLPLARELLGNGNNIYANLALRPELSHNVNFGLFGTARFAKGHHRLSYEVNGFLRYVQDYIHAVISESEGTYQYENVQDVNVRGVEGELRYSYEFGHRKNLLELTTNVTWQKAINMNETTAGGRPSVIYKNNIPNKPWLFSNAELDYSRNGLLFRHDKLKIDYQYQYVHWFYLTWEGYGALQSKSTIPTQHTHSAHLTYSWQNDRYNITLGCENLTNAILYDNYKLQKPGRAFMAKFKLFLK